MKRSVVGVVFSVLSAGGGAAFAQLNEAQVIQAIQAGESGKFQSLLSTCLATPSFGQIMTSGSSGTGGIRRDGDYTVATSSSEGRIATLASTAKKMSKPLTPAHVGKELRSNDVFVAVDSVAPSESSSTISVSAVIKPVVLKSKTRPDLVVQPIKVDSEVVSWSNLFGAKVDANRVLARFGGNDVRELPPGDVDVVVVTKEGERRCKIGSKDRQRLFGHP
jgi:hypothetical protein